MDIIKRNNSIIEDSLKGLNVKQLKDKYNLSESMIRIILIENNSTNRIENVKAIERYNSLYL